MSSVINRYAKPKTASPTACESKPQKCTTCGQLECLCRPRFFAGQVLTADDLNRLDYYIRAKHRLHNRQLHGWGVVNGLEVTCDPCGKGVVVGCGYALSPCGDDIVVCEPVLVDVCALIKACREAERLAQPCAPFQHAQPAGCCEGESEWVLAIRYAESPARNVKPLMSGTANGCGCGGAAGSCTCRTAPASKPRTAPVQCEPTVVCEGFEFEVYRKPRDETDPCGRNDHRYPLALNPNSELYQRLRCCGEMLIERFPRLPDAETASSNPRAVYQWMCAFKEFLQRYLSSRTGYNCELLARLNGIACPSYDEKDIQRVYETIWLLTLVWLDAILACFCSALLPPCPEPQPDPRVPIATLRVGSDSCRVLSICNWTHHRKLAATFPALQYWLELLPFGDQFRCLLERICCFQIMSAAPQKDETTHGFQPSEEFPSTGHTAGVFQSGYYARAQQRLNPQIADPERLGGVSSLLLGALARGRENLDPRTFVESFFLSSGEERSAAHLSSAEMANLPQFLLLNQILRPLAAGAFGPLFERRDEFGPVLRSAAAPDETAALKQQIAALQARLDAQEKKIAELGKKSGGK
jgi:hypothetical protein